MAERAIENNKAGARNTAPNPSNGSVNTPSTAKDVTWMRIRPRKKDSVTKHKENQLLALKRINVPVKPLKLTGNLGNDTMLTTPD